MAIPQPYSALLDDSTTALLFLTDRIPVIVFLAKVMPEVEHLYCVNYPNYLQEFPLVTARPETWPEWSWDEKKRIFEPTAKDLLTDRLRLCNALAVKKSLVLVEVIRTLTMARYPAWNGTPMQDVIYITKKMQAQRFKDMGYPEGNDLDFPYVLQYADFASLSMREAADEILLKAGFADDLMLRSEFFRLKYFGQIADANTVEDVDRLILDFRRDIYKALEVERAVYPL